MLVGLMGGWAVGCGEDEVRAVEYGELCGVEGPVRVLELAPDQRGGSWSFGDRLYHSVARVLPVESKWGELELWSTGPCGEAPVRVATDVWGPVRIERWPERLFGCHTRDGIVSLDPAGVAVPHPVFATADCHPAWTEYGGVLREEHADDDMVTSVVLYPYPGDPGGETSEGVPLFDRCHSWYINVDVDRGVVHCPTLEGELMRISLADQSATVVQTDVGSYQFSADLRYLAWETREATAQGQRLLSLRDDSTGVTISLGTASITTYFQFIAGEQPLLLAGSRVYFLPGLDFIDMSRSVRFSAVLADGRWLLEDTSGSPWLSVFDPGDRSIKPLFSRPAALVGVAAESARVLGISPLIDPETWNDQGRLWSVPFDGAKARVLAERATRFVRPVGATRMMDILDVDEEDIGELVLIDTADRSEQVVDARAYGWSVEDEVLSFGVADGERSGLWRARLADGE